MISVDEINKLQTENKRLNDIIDSYQPRLQALENENKQLKELFEIESLTDITTGETMYRSKQIIHFVDVLQEIKAIAEELLEKGLEPQSVEHQLRLKGKRELASIIIDLITKAEGK